MYPILSIARLEIPEMLLRFQECYRCVASCRCHERAGCKPCQGTAFPQLYKSRASVNFWVCLNMSRRYEGFALRPEQFKRLGEKLHPSEYAKYFPENKAIFDKVRNGIKIETYNSKLQELMKPPVNAELLTAHLMLRPGMFARYLDFALRSCKDTTAMEDVLFRFISVCKSVEPRRSGPAYQPFPESE